MSVTQKQIAERVGVSQSIVARALKGHTEVSVQTRERVEEAAKQLGYSSDSNGAARALRARRSGSQPRTHSLAVLMGDFFEGLPLHDVPFFKPILRGLKAEAQRREVDLLFSNVDTLRLPRLLTQGGVDGVINLYTDPFSTDLTKQLPCYLLRVGDGAPEEWTLRPDDQQGIYLATRHLIEQGHRHIAYLGDSRRQDNSDLAYQSRLEGYFQALQEGGLAVCNALVEAHIGAPDHEAGAAGMARIIERNKDITAVVCFNDTSALGAIAELKRRGLRIPDDVSVTGFDDVWEAYGEEPALTTVYFDRFEMGRRAVESICDAADAGSWVAGENSGSHELLPVKLIGRASTSAPRSNNN